MDEDTWNLWSAIVGDIVLGFGSIECWTKYLVEISSGDEGHVHQAAGLEGRIERVISLLGQEPECLVARKYGKNRLDRVLGIARDLKSVRNDIAHNPLELCSGALTIHDATTTRLTGDVSYAKQYTLEQLLEIRMQVNVLLKEIRLMQVECGD